MGYIAELEYCVPGVGEADIVAGAYIWEVKPIGARAGDQPDKYILATGYDAGFDIQTITDIPIIKKVRMKIESSGEGVLRYSFYEGNESRVSTDVKKMVSRVLFWVAAAAVIMGATLVEDALTGGAGLADDVASLGLAGAAAGAILGI